MTQVADILTLQTLDDEAAALRAAHADIEQRLRGDQELDDARRDLSEIDGSIAALQRDQRRCEAAIEDLNSKIIPGEKKLYDGSIHSPKELSNLQHEIDFLKGGRSKHEDELLDTMARLEVAERERHRARQLVAQLEKRWDVTQQELRIDASRINDAIARVEQKRALQEPVIQPRSLALYEELRRKKGGLAVARLQGGVCTGCRIQVPDAIRKRIFLPHALAQCPSCERLLFAG